MLTHPADLRVEVTGRFTVGAEVDQCVSARGRHRGEAVPVVAQQLALQIIVPEASDAPTAVDPLPQVGEDGGDVVQSPGEVVRPPEAVPGIGTACADVRLPGEGGRHAGDLRLLAGGGDGGQHARPGHGEHDVRPVRTGQIAHGPPGRLRIGAAVAHGDGHVVAASAVADVREAGCERPQDVRQRGPERGQPTRQGCYYAYTQGS
ncbi:hypothetical protein GCM10027074_53750 [Streptomyces deserti]